MLPGTDSVMSSADRRSKLRWTELRVAAVQDEPRPRKVDLTCQVFQDRTSYSTATKTGQLVTFRRSRYSFKEKVKKFVKSKRD